RGVDLIRERAALVPFGIDRAASVAEQMVERIPADETGQPDIRRDQPGSSMPAVQNIACHQQIDHGPGEQQRCQYQAQQTIGKSEILDDTKTRSNGFHGFLPRAFTLFWSGYRIRQPAALRV